MASGLQIHFNQNNIIVLRLKIKGLEWLFLKSHYFDAIFAARNKKVWLWQSDYISALSDVVLWLLAGELQIYPVRNDTVFNIIAI